MAIEPYENATIDLWELGFMFAVENMDPKVGRVEVNQVHYESGEEIIKYVTPLELVRCEELWKKNAFNNQNFQYSKLQQGKKPFGWLCPSELESLEVRGSWGAPNFDYVQINLLGCNLGSECIPKEELHRRVFNLSILKARPNLLAENKEETILYETDMSTFFYVEPRMYQTENIYLMESTITLEDNIWDLLKFDEQSQRLA